MEIDVLTVGIDPYENNTKRLVESLTRYEPDAGLVIVDAAASPPYPRHHYVYRLNKRPSGFAAGLNVAANLSAAEWMVMVNNDVEFTGQFSEQLAALVPGVYGNHMMREYGWPEWLDGWVMAIHRQVWEACGEWDENFKAGAFEDADYCWRARDAGFPVKEIRLPIIHHDSHTRFTNPDFWRVRAENMGYLREKWQL